MRSNLPVVDAQHGKIDPDQTMALLKGWKDDAASPRGVIHDRSGYPRHRAERICAGVSRSLINDQTCKAIELEAIPMVKDPWKEINHQ